MNLKIMTPGDYDTTTLRENVNGVMGFAHGVKFLNSIQSDTPYNYIVTGDSTRSNGYNRMIEYYTGQLSKINWSLYDNAESGLKTAEWLSNTRNASLNNAISNTPSQGEQTILEFSLGINDTGTDAEKKANFLLAINNYLSAKPKATVVLVSPVGSVSGRASLTSIYREIANELGLYMIDGSKIIDGVVSNSDFMADETHPNQYGSRRIVNSIFSYLLPSEMKLAMTMEEDGLPLLPDTNLEAVVQGGYWFIPGGDYSDTPWELENRRSLDKIEVEPNFTIKIDHGGNMFQCVFYDVNGDYISWTESTQISGNEREVAIPNGAYFVAINVSNDSAGWDSLNYTPTVEYKIQEAGYLTQKEINSGIYVSLPYLINSNIDSLGNYPSIGQVATGQPNGSWLWV